MLIIASDSDHDYTYMCLVRELSSHYCCHHMLHSCSVGGCDGMFVRRFIAPRNDADAVHCN